MHSNCTSAVFLNSDMTTDKRETTASLIRQDNIISLWLIIRCHLGSMARSYNTVSIVSGELSPEDLHKWALMSFEQGCFAWSFQFWLPILFVCLGTFKSTHNWSSPAVAWLEWNDSTALVFLKQTSKTEARVLALTASPVQDPIRGLAWCQRTIRNLIAQADHPSRLFQNRSIKRSKYRFLRHHDGQLFVSTLVML